MMLCVVIKGPTFQEAHHQILKALAYADLLELRLDYFTSLDLTALQNLRSHFSIPMIFTLKRKRQQAGNPFCIEKQAADLLALMALKPEYLDLEEPIPPVLIKEVLALHPDVKLILSYHNFVETPQDFDEIYQNMQKTPAFFYKMAVTANRPLEALKFICWAKMHPKLIAVSMSEAGQASRLIGPLLGCPITYAALDEKQRSAPGQLSVETLIKRYHHSTLSPRTALYGLIGDPVDLSISDETHNAFFNACGLDAVYVKIQLNPSELFDFLQLAKKLPFCGISVTMPLKEHIVGFIDEMDSHAYEIGAVNTLLFKDERIFGYNTDGIGALNAIERQGLVKDKRIFIIGAGGSSKAIAYEAIQRGAQVTILNRDKEKALKMAHRLNCVGKGLDEIKACAKTGYDILINCTPTALPIVSDHFIPGTLVMDIITKPKETLFLKEALKKKCRIVYGYQMFIEQAIGQFNLWFKNCLTFPESQSILEKKVIESLSKVIESLSTDN